MSVQVNRTTVRRKDTSQCVQCGGFSTSVLTDDTKDLAFANVEGNSFTATNGQVSDVSDEAEFS